ncbi:MAG: VCBS repeat-containing protein [Chitinophagaceae bacterium]|nr:VCBS repeat-containing protein [Chitinophagaceae bacterium]
MVINTLEEKALILKNNTENKKSIVLSFKGESLNKYGLGAKAYLFTKNGLQYQQLTLTRGFQSSVEPKLFFGLDTLSIVDSMLIVWPDQTYQLLKNLAAGKAVELRKAGAQDFFDYTQWFRNKKVFSPVELLSGWKHKENDFYDFNIQYLIPHKLSTRGPKVAVADVNGDGLDDMYVCGGKTQPGALFIQKQDGSFAESNKPIFEIDAGSEDVDAAFFDANGDKHPDLLVTSGGNEVLKASIEGADRLYLNDGKGNFKKSELAFPIQYESKSCITYADIDKDGDNDFFIGNLASQTAYGQPVNSYLYLNNGNAKFDLATRETIFLQAVGMVTSAAFADVNNDTWPDLVITGEWMPLKIFINSKGRFTETAVPQSTGLWQCLLPADVNSDGFVDFLAGNWGHNSKLWSGKNGPLKLYMKDFDNNGAVEQVLCYTIDGKEYTFLAKDELERSLPVLKKAYLKYSEVAGKTVQYLFYDLFKDYQELKAEVLSSSCFINDGKGNFVRIDLPEELQMAPLMSFAKNEIARQASFVAAGNYYGVTPYEGRYDGMLPAAFSYDKQKKTFILDGIISTFDGEARDIKWVTQAGRNKLMLITRNNNTISFYRANY